MPHRSRRPPRPRARGRALLRAFALAVLAALAGLGCTDRGPLAPPTLEPLQVRPDGTWFRDTKGRVVLLRGANYSSLERQHAAGQTPQPRAEDFAWLASLGFNLIRLPIAWGAVEPLPQFFDPTFLRDHVDPILREANNNGMQVILALHRGRWSECLTGGEGVPRWACLGLGLGLEPEGDPSPDAVDAIAARAECAFFTGGTALDGRELREHYADTWRLIAQYYEQDRRIAAFDLLDEPTPGTCGPRERFVREHLVPLYEKLVEVVRARGAPHAILYQPAIGPGSALLGAPEGLGPTAILGPHLYSQTFGPTAPRARLARSLEDLYARAVLLARRLGGPLLIGEIGGDRAPHDGVRGTSPTMMRASFGELDRLLIGGAVWTYVPPPEPGRAAAQGIGNEADATVLSRTFARRIAGIPLAMQFDDVTGIFTLTFRDDPLLKPPDPSEIFVPAKRRYPSGFSVHVGDGARWRWDEHTQRVLFYRGPGSEHTVRIVPAAFSRVVDPAAGLG